MKIRKIAVFKEEQIKDKLIDTLKSKGLSCSYSDLHSISTNYLL